MNNTDHVSKQTLYISVMVALLVGFLAGVAFYTYRSPLGDGVRQAARENRGVQQRIAEAEQATQKSPKDPKTWVLLGHAYFDSQQPQKAIEAYDKALELRPNDLNVMTDMGVMYYQNNQYKQAIEIFDKVLKLDAKHEQARFNKGVVLLNGLHETQQALAEWRTLVHYHPMAATPSGHMVADLIDQVEHNTQNKP